MTRSNRVNRLTGACSREGPGGNVANAAVYRPTDVATDDASRSHDLLLDNQLCFALYAGARAFARAYREWLEPMGLTYPQYLVLLVLWQQDGITVSDVGRRLMLDSGTLTPLIKRLEAMGLVHRERGTVDEREVRVWVTDQGTALRDGARAAQRGMIQRLDLPEPEIASLRAAIMDLIGRLGINDKVH